MAIANSRLICLDEQGVTFKYKDHRAKGRCRYKRMTLRVEEFMRRGLHHGQEARPHEPRLGNPD